MAELFSIFPEPVVHGDTTVANKALVIKSVDRSQVFSAQRVVDKVIVGAKLSSVKIHAIQSGTGTLKLKYTLMHIDADADPATPVKVESSTFESVTPAGANGQRFSFSIPASLLTLSDIDFGDIVGFGLQRGAVSDGDTYTGTLDVVQIDIELDAPAATAATSDLVSLSVVKEYLNINDNNADAFLQKWIGFISKKVEAYTEKKIALQTVTGEIHDGDGTRILRPRYWPIVRLDGANDAAKLASLQKRDDPDSAWVNIETNINHIFIFDDRPWQIELYDEIFPFGQRNIKVSYVAGYATVPEELQRLCVEEVAMVWKEANRRGGFRLGEGSETRTVDGVSHTKTFIDLEKRWRQVLDYYKSYYNS